MKIGICDDNIIYLNYLKDFVLNISSPKFDASIDALHPDQLFQLIKMQNCSYDIIITDIDMGNFNGIQFAKEINRINPSCIIIFVSSYLNFATEVYDVNHIYFVLKSELEFRLPKALEKAHALYQDNKKNILNFRYQNIDYMLSLPEITHIEALGRYLYIHDMTNTYKCIGSLKLIQAELPNSFIRCHNSFIVNLTHVRSMSRVSCVLSSGITIPVSQTYSKQLQASYITYVSKKL
ncbi:MAG: Response regulator of the LytR/AlgR family [Herbinix sp.]|nr:Response regulator of the LytR/AlgR family [Herbinix sp.]